MAKPRIRPNVKEPWSSEAALKAAVLAQCAKEFHKIFERSWDPACKTGLVVIHRRLLAQDQAARELWNGLRRLVGEIERFAQEWVLLPADLATVPVSTPRGFSLAVWYEDHGSHVGPAKENKHEMSRVPDSTRGLVIQKWAHVDLRSLPYQSTELPKTPDTEFRFPGCDDKLRREQSNRDLAIVSLLCGSWPKINSKDLDAGISVATVIDRERKNIENARKHLPDPR